MLTVERPVLSLMAIGWCCTWLQEVFDSADVDRVGELDEFEVVRLMKKLNNSLATVKIQQKLKVSISFCCILHFILFFIVSCMMCTRTINELCD